MRYALGELGTNDGGIIMEKHNYHHLVREWCKTIFNVVNLIHFVGKVVELIVKLSDLVSFYSKGAYYRRCIHPPAGFKSTN